MSYKRDLADALLLLGFLSPNKTYYGAARFYEESVYKHVGQDSRELFYPPALSGKPPQCGKWKSLRDVKEESIPQFAETGFDSPQTDVIEARLSCACGEIEDLKLFYDGTMADLLNHALNNGDNWLE